VDGRTGAVLCTSNCFVVAKLLDRGKAIILAWGIGGEDTRAAAAYLHYYGRDLITARHNTARVIQWNYWTYEGLKVGITFRTLATWP